MEGADGKVLYVWFDAPIGYISATKEYCKNNGLDADLLWNDKDTKLVHFIGKDNIVFHCIIFPVMLKLHNNILPANVPANEFVNLEGDKMSTSRNWKLEMQDYIDDFINKENGGPAMADVLRYYLTTIMPESKDSEFTWKGFQDANNSELVAIFGNFINRSFVLMHKLCNGKVPPLHAAMLDDKDHQLIQDIEDAKIKIENAIENYKFREGLFEVIDLARKGNRYMQDKEPWIVAKSLAETPLNQQLIDNCLHLCLQLSANLAIFINPFLPQTATRLCHMMKVVDKMLEWKNGGRIKLLSVGYSLRAPELLFRKIEDSEIQAQVEKLKQGALRAEAAKNQASAAAETPSEVPDTPEIKSEIVFDDFAKIDLRVGTILNAERIPKADKLLKLEVDMGSETRTICSGIAEHFTPEEIIGKQVTVVANLAPRKMRGIVSNGMILMSEDQAGKLVFVNPAVAVPNGKTVN